MGNKPTTLTIPSRVATDLGSLAKHHRLTKARMIRKLVVDAEERNSASAIRWCTTVTSEDVALAIKGYAELRLSNPFHFAELIDFAVYGSGGDISTTLFWAEKNSNEDVCCTVSLKFQRDKLVLSVSFDDLCAENLPEDFIVKLTCEEASDLSEELRKAGSECFGVSKAA